MDTPQRIQAAQADRPFQFFLAKCFGKAMTGTDPESGVICKGFGWRGVVYVPEVTEPLTPPK